MVYQFEAMGFEADSRWPGSEEKPVQSMTP